jgi:hypothetical protein
MSIAVPPALLDSAILLARPFCRNLPLLQWTASLCKRLTWVVSATLRTSWYASIDHQFKNLDNPLCHLQSIESSLSPVRHQVHYLEGLENSSLEDVLLSMEELRRKCCEPGGNLL